MVVAVSTLLFSCGDSVTNLAYRGAPLFQFEGQVEVQGAFSGGEHDIRMSIFWLPDAGWTTEEQWAEQPSTSIRVEFPSTFSIKIYHPPRESDYFQRGVGGQITQAIGRLVLYDDLNGDGRRDAGEPVVGEAPNQGIMYASKDLEAEASFTGVAVKRGFSLIHYPIRCFSRLSPRQDVACLSPLGDPCLTNADCCGPDEDCDTYGGVCLFENSGTQPFPRGYCAAPLQSVGCESVANGSVVPSKTIGRPVEIRIVNRVGRLILKACDSTLSCRDDYFCDPAHRVCLPDLPVALVLDPGLVPSEICVDPEERVDTP